MNTSLFDLNQLAPSEEDLEDIIHRDREESRGAIPLLVHSYSANNLVLDMGDNEEARCRYWDLNFESIEDVRDDDHERKGDGDTEEDSNEDAQVHEQSNVPNKRKLFLTMLKESKFIMLYWKEMTEEDQVTRLTKYLTYYRYQYVTVQRIWKLNKSTGVTLDTKKRKIFGRPKVQVDLNRIMDIDLNKRTTLRSLSEALGISHSVLYRLFKGLIRRHPNTINPLLKEEHKWACLRFFLSMLDQCTIPLEPKFVVMYYIVRIDEKWFYFTKKIEKYYLLPIEAIPCEHVKVNIL